jgi:hypothetical protein
MTLRWDLKWRLLRFKVTTMEVLGVNIVKTVNLKFETRIWQGSLRRYRVQKQKQVLLPKRDIISMGVLILFTIAIML